MVVLYFLPYTLHIITLLLIVCRSYLFDQVEVSTGQFPYREWNSIFDQLMQVVQGDPPCLDVEKDQFSPDFVDFVNTW